MPATSLTLLERLRTHSRAEDWGRFVRLYAPLLLHWARRQGFNDADAEDVAQAVLVKLVRVLPTYQRREGHTFRGWLFTICRNQAREFRNRAATRSLPNAEGLEEVTSPIPESDPDDIEYRKQLVAQALDLVRPDFTEATWVAFTRFVIEGRSAGAVAAELGASANAVYLARHRVLARLREELAGLLD